MSKKAKGFYQYVTTLHLNRPFKHIKTARDCRLIAPDGFSIIYRLKPTRDLRALFSHVGITIHEMRTRREMRGCTIGGVPMEIIDPLTLQYCSKNKRTATHLYNKNIKPALNKQRYAILHHECTTLRTEGNTKDCHEGTLKDRRFTVVDKATV